MHSAAAVRSGNAAGSADARIDADCGHDPNVNCIEWCAIGNAVYDARTIAHADTVHAVAAVCATIADAITERAGRNCTDPVRVRKPVAQRFGLGVRFGHGACSRSIAVAGRIGYNVAGSIGNADAVRAADADSVYHAVSLDAVSFTFGQRHHDCDAGFIADGDAAHPSSSAAAAVFGIAAAVFRCFRRRRKCFDRSIERAVADNLALPAFTRGN